jgi:hypothetical protein
MREAQQGGQRTVAHFDLKRTQYDNNAQARANIGRKRCGWCSRNRTREECVSSLACLEKRRMLDPFPFPEYCRTPSGNPPRP